MVDNSAAIGHSALSGTAENFRSSNPRLKRRWTLGVAGLVLVVAACGSSNNDDTGTVPSSSAVVETSGPAAVDTASSVDAADVPAASVTETDQPIVTDTAAPTVAASCAFEYNDATLAERSWAFDGTLLSISTGQDSKLGSVGTATFIVNHWYKGGAGPEVTIQYEQGPISEFAPAVDAGARLLVTGEPRWGGQPLDDAIAWACGFTQPWTPTAADQWLRVFTP